MEYYATMYNGYLGYFKAQLQMSFFFFSMQNLMLQTYCQNKTMICYTTIQKNACLIKSTIHDDTSEAFKYADLGCKNHYFVRICCLIFYEKKYFSGLFDEYINKIICNRNTI